LNKNTLFFAEALHKVVTVPKWQNQGTVFADKFTDSNFVSQPDANRDA
jgi:hypothetical protein